MQTQSLSGRFGISTISVTGFVVLWQLSVTLELVDPLILPSPWMAIQSGIRRAEGGELLHHIIASVVRITEGFFLGSVMGILIGLLMGQVRIIGEALEPLVDIFRQIPEVAWIPLAILMFRMGEGSKIFIITYGALFPAIICTFDGVKMTNPAIIRAARSLGASRGQLFWRVTLPATLPHIMTGLWIGLGYAFRGLIAAELAGAQEGIGFMIMLAREDNLTADAFMGMALIGVIGFCAIYGLGAVRNHFLRWHESTQE